MGGCLSKKTTDNSTSKPPSPQTLVTTEQTKRPEDQEKKDLFVISHDLDRFGSSEDEKGKTEQKPINVLPSDNINPTKSDAIQAAVGSGVLRTSSCTKEEIDAILIQCGRLSRSSSNGKTACSGSSENQASAHTRRYSGSKRCYDFDQDNSNNLKGTSFQRDLDFSDNDEQTTVERIRRHRQRQSSGRRRTPSRERDHQQRSGSSRERNTNSSGTARRVSRSPGRRSESPTAGITSGNVTVTKPGKIVSVPATVTSLVMEKSSNLCDDPPSSSSAIKRVQPNEKEIPVVRSQSPARANFRSAIENPNAQSGPQQQQPLSLSRSSSRKAEQSPFRRNPFGEIDQNMTTVYQKGNNNPSPSPTSYTALLLEDIQNFHQKKKELPLAESEAAVKDVSLEQSIHQYVTVRRSREEEEESSGSNSIVSTGAHTCSKDDARTTRMNDKKRPGFENKQKGAPRIRRNSIL